MKALKEQVEKLQLQGRHTATNESTTSAVEGMVHGKVNGAAGAMPTDGTTAGAARDANTVTFSKQKLALLQGEYDPKACSHCKKSLPVDQLKKCNKCQVAKYCSKPCQVSDWKQKHMRHCKEMMRLKEAVAGGGNAVASPAPSGALDGKSIQVEQGIEYYHACIEGNQLIVVGGMPTGDHSVVVYDTTTGDKIASSVPWSGVAIAGISVAKNNNGESLLVVSVLSNPNWRIELWSADFRRPRLLDTLSTPPGMAGPPCFTDGKLLVTNMMWCCIDIYDVSSSKIKRVGGYILLLWQNRKIRLFFQ